MTASCARSLLSEEPECGHQLVSVACCNGLPLTADWIAGQIRPRVRED